MIHGRELIGRHLIQGIKGTRDRELAPSYKGTRVPQVSLGTRSVILQK